MAKYPVWNAKARPTRAEPDKVKVTPTRQDLAVALDGFIRAEAVLCGIDYLTALEKVKQEHPDFVKKVYPFGR